MSDVAHLDRLCRFGCGVGLDNDPVLARARLTIGLRCHEAPLSEEKIREIVREEIQYSRQRCCRECNSYFSLGHRQSCPDFNRARP